MTVVRRHDAVEERDGAIDEELPLRPSDPALEVSIVLMLAAGLVTLAAFVVDLTGYARADALVVSLAAVTFAILAVAVAVLRRAPR